MNLTRGRPHLSRETTTTSFSRSNAMRLSAAVIGGGGQSGINIESSTSRWSGFIQGQQ